MNFVRLAGAYTFLNGFLRQVVPVSAEALLTPQGGPSARLIRCGLTLDSARQWS